MFRGVFIENWSVRIREAVKFQKMIKISILITFLSHLLHTVVQVQSYSCLDYFTYASESGPVFGQIEIPPPQPNEEFYLRVALQINDNPYEKPESVYSELSLAKSVTESVRAVQQGKPLLYNIYFISRRLYPTVEAIWFNEERYCPGPDRSGKLNATIELNHIVYAPDESSLNSLYRNYTAFRMTNPPLEYLNFPTRIYIRQQTTTLATGIGFANTQEEWNKTSSSLQFWDPTMGFNNDSSTNNNDNTDNDKKSSSPHSTVAFNNDNSTNNNDIINSNECGRIYQMSAGDISSRINQAAGNVNLLITKGKKTLPGQWPWVVALFIVRIIYEFQCAGSLLTTRHVLTAAHCLKHNTTSNNDIPSNVLTVALGRFKLHQWREEGTLNLYVASYKIHPDYAHSSSGDSDMAILILRTPAEYNPFIKPICLWSGPIELQSVVDRSGFVVGWGQDELGHPYTEDPRMVKAPIVSQEDCLWSDPSFVRLTSQRTFCAGARDGSSPCNGDSGSGLVILNATTNRYELRGIVSRSVTGEQMLCDSTKYVVYVDIAKFLPWIREQISTT